MDNDSQPKAPDAQAGASADAGAGGAEANQQSEAAKAAVDLKKLSEALGREVKDVDDALKAVKNLHGMVGDRTIADLRKKAEAHDTLENLVRGYAEEEGLELEEARKQLSQLAKSKVSKDERVDGVLKEISDLKLQLQEKDFLDSHPEAKALVKELKTMAQATGQSLADVYESSSLKELATKAAASGERDNKGTSVRPQGRQMPQSDRAKEALERLKHDRSGDAQDNYVKAVLGL